MKKNFLLLMLMALLPLAGWATDLNDPEVKFSVGTHEYGSGDALYILVSYDVRLEKGEDKDYTLDPKYYSDEACTKQAGIYNNNGILVSAYTLETLPAGNYYIKITGKNAFTGTRSQVFEVTKAPLDLEYNGESLNKVYGDADKTATKSFSATDASQLKNGDVLNNILKGTVSYTLSSQNAGGRYAIFSGITAANYDVKIANKSVEISKATIPTDGAGFTFTLGGASKTYNGLGQKANYTGTWSTKGKTLVQDTDFELKFYTDQNRTTDESTTVTTFGTYYVKIVGKGNYQGEFPLPADLEDANFKFAISKAGLTVRALDQYKTYNGNKDLPSLLIGEAYEILGAQNGDSFDDFTASNFTVSGNKNVGTKTITPRNIAGANIANYDVNYVAATLTINKKNLRIKANNSSKVYGSSDPSNFSGVTFTGAISGETDGMLASTYTDGSGVTHVFGDVKVTRSNASVNSRGDYSGVLVVSYNSDYAPFNNYNITTQAGNFSITGGKIYITALNQTKVYGDADPSWTAQVGENYIISGLDPNDALVTEPTLSRVNPAGTGNNVGDYPINIAGAAAPAGYEEIVYAPATFTITKAPLTVTLPIKTVESGKNETTTLGQITKDGITITGFKGSEVANDSYTLSLNNDPTTGLTQTGGVYDAQVNAVGYILTLKDAIYANYAINGEQTAAGKLIVGEPVATDFAINPATDNNLFDDIQAADQETRTAKFTLNRGNSTIATYNDGWRAGEWNVLVLPFEISVSDLSRALGYAVVNVIDPTKGRVEGTVARLGFKLEMGLNGAKIPANTPIMVKTSDPIAANVEINFGERKIIAPASAEVSVAASAKDNLDFKFIGTYNAKILNNSTPQIQFLAGNDDSENDVKYIKSTSTNIFMVVPFNGYFDAPVPAGVRTVEIEFEELDGTTTVIRTVDAQANGAKVNAEGWYNLNGVKMQAAPTQKGIYIHNGKKIVVK